MDEIELREVIAELQRLGMDHQRVEAKAARNGLPVSIWDTLSAFSNTNDGLILLGIRERSKVVEIVGVEETNGVFQAFQEACAMMEPPVRPTFLDVIEIDGVSVIAAGVPVIDKARRPCHRGDREQFQASFKRVGDRDEVMRPDEIHELLLVRKGEDSSLRPAPSGAVLDDSAVRAFLSGLDDSRSQTDLLRHWNVETDDGQPTLAGYLSLGQSPERILPAASITYRRLPQRGDPADMREAGTHYGGRIGQMLTAVMQRLVSDLDELQIQDSSGRVFDDSEIPRKALREIVANALLHRSLSPGRDLTSVLVEVTSDAVSVTSPGVLPVGVALADLGLTRISPARNYALVRLCERIRTEDGARINEHQQRGINAADRACRVAGTMPALFAEEPLSLTAYLLRGVIVTDDASALLRSALPDEADDPNLLRLLSVALALRKMHESTSPARATRQPLDVVFAARALGAGSIEDVAPCLKSLVDAGLLQRKRLFNATVWDVSLAVDEAADSGVLPKSNRRSQAKRSQRSRKVAKRGDRIPILLKAFEADDSALSPSQIADAIGVSSPTSRKVWIDKAVGAGLIAAKRSNPFDPNQVYLLTTAGKARRKKELDSQESSQDT